MKTDSPRFTIDKGVAISCVVLTFVAGLAWGFLLGVLLMKGLLLD